MDEKKKRTPRGQPKVRHVLNLSQEATDVLAEMRARYPRIASKSDGVDAAIKCWARYGKLYGIDGDFQPMLPNDHDGPAAAVRPRKAS